MRATYLLFDEIFDALGGIEKASAALGTDAWVLRKVEQPADKNGREPTVKLVQKTLETLSTGGFLAQNLNDELLMHFAGPARRYTIRPEWLSEIELIIGAIKSGLGLAREGTMLCPVHGEPITIISAGVFYCEACGKGR